MKGLQIRYTASQLDWIESHKLMVRSEAHAAFCVQFGRTDVSAANYNALCKRKGWMTGRTGRIEAGNVPVNKGKPCEPGRGGLHPNARKAHFKAGGAPHNTNYLGHERISKDGYVEISVDQVNPHTGYERRYVLKHRYVWEKANGPLPAGHCLKCLGEDKTNAEPSNWEVIPRALLPALNGGRGRRLAYDQAEPELKPAILTVAKLRHALKRRRAA